MAEESGGRSHSVLVRCEMDCAVVVAITRALHLSAPLYLFNLLDNIHFDINLFAVAIVVFVLLLPFCVMPHFSSCSNITSTNVTQSTMSSSSLVRSTRRRLPFNNVHCVDIMFFSLVSLYVRRFSFYVRFLLCIINVYAALRRRTALTFFRQANWGVVELEWQTYADGVYAHQ